MRVVNKISYTPINIDKVKELIYCGLSANQIAREVDCGANAVYNAVKKSGDPDLEKYLRANGGNRQLKPPKPKIPAT